VVWAAEWVAWAEWIIDPKTPENFGAKSNLTNDYSSRVRNDPAVLFAQRMKALSLIRRTVVVIAIMIAALVLVAVIAVAIPVEFRLGSWRNLPSLDRRLLPHLSTLFSSVFGAFFGALWAFYLARVKQRIDSSRKTPCSFGSDAIRSDVAMEHR
jgi:hypothetical protein